MSEQLPAEVWYAEPEVCAPTVTGEIGWLIWMWNGDPADYPGYVASCESYEIAAWIVEQHNSVIPAPPDMGTPT